jgi:hypothetical protein
MPSVKNNFLKGKMNKDLDDRLVPQGEYRDAKNIRITKSDTEDAGVVQNIKGNVLIADPAFGSGYEIIGQFFDETSNQIFYFSTDNSNSYVSLYDVTASTNYKLIQSPNSPHSTFNWLNFHKDNLITGINVIDDLLFWTDNRNQPRKINIETAKGNGNFYNTEDKVSVAKYAPYKVAELQMSNDSSITGDYIQERFVRFSYRYKYEDNEYSVLAPFTQIAFQMGAGNQHNTDSSKLTSTEIENTYKSTILDKMVNGANKVVLTIPLPAAYAYDNFEVCEVDVLIKDSNSTAVRILETIDVKNETASEITYTYKSSLPTKTLPPDQVTRVSDKVPVRALAQEIAGNRLIYGNITENITFVEGGNVGEISEKGKLPVINYTVTYEPKDYLGSTNFNHLPHHSIKQRRTYQVGIVLSDRYGRQSPVILSENSTIYVPAKDDTFQSNNWIGDCLVVEFTPYSTANNNIVDVAHVYDAETNPYGWYSYKFVVKQLEQEYYNVYLPGAQKYEDTGYITLHGDNINKVPQSTTGGSTDTRLGVSDTRLFPKVINTSTFTYNGFNLTADNTMEFRANKVLNNNTATITINNYTPPVHYFGFGPGWGGNASPFVEIISNNTAYIKNNDLDSNYPNGKVPLHPASNEPFSQDTPHSGTPVSNTPTAAYLFVDGVFIQEITTGITNINVSTGNVTFNYDISIALGTTINSGQYWDLFLSYSVPLDSHNNSSNASTAEFLSMTDIGFSNGSPQVLPSTLDTEFVGLTGESTDPPSQSFSIYEQIQKQSDGDLLNVNGMGTLDLFENLRNEDIKSGSEVGFFQKDSKHVIASLSRTKADDSNIFPTLNISTGNQIGGKAIDLAVFETEPRESALDLFFESSTTDTADGLISELNSQNNVEFTCTEAAVTGFEVSVAGVITAPTVAEGTISSITYVGASGSSYPTVSTDTVRTANVEITPPSTGYSNSGSTETIICSITTTQLVTVAPLNIDDTAVTDLSNTGFTANADVKSKGGNSITEKGFYFGTNNTTFNGSGNTKFTNNLAGNTGDVTGDFSRPFTTSDAGFSAGTTRYLWSFVTTSAGTDSDGPSVVNIPANPTAPTGITTTIPTTTSSSLTAQGVFTSNGGSTITETGFYIGTNATTYNGGGNTRHTTNPSDLSSPFSFIRTGLTSSTTYYATAFVKNSVGEAQGNTVSTTTSGSAVAPSVTTNAETGVLTTGFIANGDVTSDGGAVITERGFFIKVDGGSYQKYAVSGTTGSFTYTFTGGSASQVYYYYAFATNSVGTTNGAVETVTLSSGNGGGDVDTASVKVYFNPSSLFGITGTLASNSPSNLSRTGDVNTAFTNMTRTYEPTSGYSFTSVDNLTVTLPNPNTEHSLTVNKALTGGNIVLTIGGNIGSADNIDQVSSNTIAVSGGPVSGTATSVSSVQYSAVSSSGPWSTLTDNANPGISTSPGETIYVKITPDGTYSLDNSGSNSSFLSISPTTNTTGNTLVHTFTYGANNTGSPVSVSVLVSAGSSTLFTINSRISDIT